MQEQILEALEEVEQVEESDPEVKEDDDKIEAPKKKPRTQKQIDAFKAVCEKRTLAREGRAKDLDEKSIIYKKELDNKIIKKAIKIAKQKLRDEKILADDDDDELEKKPTVKKGLVKTTAPTPPPPPVAKFIFV